MSLLIGMAPAGFAKEELRIHVKGSMLVVAGVNEPNDKGRNFLHRGVGARSFERRFQLADFVEVRSAELEGALLHN